MPTTASRPESSAETALLRRLRGDYEYWARVCYRILDKHDRILPLKLKPLQRKIGEIEARELARRGMARLYVLKGRQGGITTDQQGRSLHTIWRSPGAKCLTLADTRERTDAIFGITTRAVDLFPPELRPEIGAAETREISFPALDSSFVTGTAGALETGRGMTLKRLHGSEFAFWKKPTKTLNAATPALERPGTTVILETTAALFGGDAHDFWLRSESGTTGYVPLFFPWWLCDWRIYRTPLEAPDELGKLEDDERLLVATHGLTLPHIKWRRAKIGAMGRDEFLQEYAEDAASCWLSAGGSFFSSELLKALLLRAQALEPIEVLEDGALRIYSRLERGESAIAGGDTAEGGTNNDRSTLVFRESRTWRLLATYESSLVEPDEYAAVANRYGRVFGEALLVIEKNLHGITVLRKLRDVHGYPRNRIYHRATLDDANNSKLERIGWVTSAESKPLMLDAGRDLLKAATEGLAGLPTESAIRDAFKVRRGDDGKFDLNGKDMLVAEMLAWIGRSAPSTTGILEMYSQLAHEAAERRRLENGGT